MLIVSRELALGDQPREADRCGVIDLVGDLRIQVPQRIVGETRRVDDSVEPVQVRRLDIPEVEPWGVFA